MDDELSRPYKKLAAVEEQIESNSLLDHYVDLYKRKYRTEPIFPVTRVHMTQIKDLQRLTKGQARVFISEYFQMKDDWISKQHHSMDCLLKSLNKIGASVAKRDAVKDLKGKIKLQFHCDSCWNEFTFICDSNFKYCDEFVQCEECKRVKARPKRVSKEERREAILKLGFAFKEIPKNEVEEDMLDLP